MFRRSTRQKLRLVPRADRAVCMQSLEARTFFSGNQQFVEVDSSISNGAFFQSISFTAEAGLTGVDLGTVVSAGSTTSITAGSDYNVISGGRDIWSGGDSMHFAYQQLDGDFDIAVRLESFSQSSSWAKAGLMVRESLHFRSRNVAMLARPGSGDYRFQYRSNTGGSTTAVGSGSASYPNTWVRLQREGSTIRGYRSSNGTSWTQVSSTTMALSTSVYVGLGASSGSDSTATTVQFRNLTGLGEPAPAPADLTSINTGTFNSPGSTTIVTPGEDYDIVSGGRDIWNTRDGMRFAYQQLSGDFNIIARLESLTNSNVWAKAGLMVRESLAAESRNVAILARPGSGDYRFQWRSATSGPTDADGDGAASYPNTWVRLQRTGNTIRGYRSSNGTSWAEVSSMSMTLPTSVYVGLAVSSASDTATTMAKFRDVSGFGAGAPGPSVPLTPSNLNAAAASDRINLTWTDNSGNETGFKIERKVAGGTYAWIGSTNADVTSFADTTAQPGIQYVYRVRATNSAGDSGATSEVSVSIPTGQAPYLGSPFQPGVRIEAENYDNGGEGIAYHDTTTANEGTRYRNDRVDIGLANDVDGGYTVGWTKAGEWLEYTINVPASGIYKLEARVASNGNGGSFHFDIDGVNATGSMAISNTGSWTNFVTISKDAYLTAGTRVLRLAMDTVGATGSVGNVNWMRFSPTTADSEWTPLFNGQNLSGFYTYIPESGKNSDPRGYFKAENGSIHILDLPATSEERDFGYLATNAEYADYHLRFQYRWGSKKFEPRADDKRDSGLLFHLTGGDKVWPRSVELQVQEGDTGDIWLLDGTSMTTTVASSSSNTKTYQEGGVTHTQRDGRVIKSSTRDSLTDWNTVEVIVTGDDAVFIVNGVVVNRMTDIRMPDPNDSSKTVPLTKGRIAFQAEGAEVFYRNIEIKSLAGEPAPSGATQLFNGGSTSQWRKRGTTSSINWPVIDGNLVVNTAGGDIETVNKYGDINLHLEFNLPATSSSLSEQSRGNSGIFLQGRYEIQILDSYQRALSNNDDMGAIYGMKNADTNAALPAGAWQQLDITFRAARWSNGVKTEDARVTVYLNGVLIHNNVAMPTSTFTGDSESSGPGPIVLQDHDNAVRFRNIWIQPT